MRDAPPEDAFPTIPATWYLFGKRRELRTRPLSKRLLGRRLVGYRSKSGRIAVLDGECSHLAADLGCGRVVGECIQCPFHHWRYDASGKCVWIPAQAEIPATARQRAYPVVERHGLLFFFAGREPLFPLPFFEGCDPSDFVRGRPFGFTADFPWYLLVGNAFDDQHFQTVHDRRLLEPAVVDEPSRYARRIRYQAEITGDSIFDRLLRPSVGRRVDISITSLGGSYVLVTGKFARITSYIMICPRPHSRDRLDVDVVVYSPRNKRRFLRGLGEWLGLEVRRLFTRGFMQDDIESLPGIRYNGRALVASDRQLIEFFHWASRLPGESHECSDAAASHDGRPDLSRPRESEARLINY